MEKHDADIRIRSAPPVANNATGIQAGGPPSQIEQAFQSDSPIPRTIWSGSMFSAFVGICMGSVVGAATCWLFGQIDFLWDSVVAGSLVGPVGGLFIALLERKRAGDLARPEMATLICIILMLAPALVILLKGLGAVQGRFSFWLFFGSIFTGPMIGFLVGGIFDRAFEARLNDRFWSSLVSGTIGVAVCVGMVMMIAIVPYAPDPVDAAQDIRAILLTQWSLKPDMKHAKIPDISLARKGGQRYTGFADVINEGHRHKVKLEIVFDEGTYSIKLHPWVE